MTNDKTDIDVYLVKHFGMTAEAIVRVMKNHRRIVNSEADEMGISPPTVRNHLEKMGLYKKGGDAK